MLLSGEGSLFNHSFWLDQLSDQVRNQEFYQSFNFLNGQRRIILGRFYLILMGFYNP